MENRKVLLVGLVQGALVAVLCGLFLVYLRDQSVLSAVVTGVVAGVVFGVATTWSNMRGQKRLTQGVTDSLSAPERAQVERASVRGPFPAEEHLLRASAELARRRQQLIDDRQFSALIVFGVLVLVSVGLAVWSDPLWWVATALLVLSVAYGQWSGRRFKERTARLLAAASRPAPDGRS